MGQPGFFGIRGPVDLLDKLAHDHRRMARNPGDWMHACDFFTTACTMHDWWRSYCGNRSDERPNWSMPTEPKERAVLELCGELGNGGKHLAMHSKKKIRSHQRQLSSAHAKTRSQRARGVLVLELQPEEVKVLGVDEVTAVQLAGAVVNYWGAWEQRRRFPLNFTS